MNRKEVITTVFILLNRFKFQSLKQQIDFKVSQLAYHSSNS